jgi:ribosomal protein L23
MDKTLVLKPRMSEKAYGLSEVRNTYVFDVPKSANRHSVARAVAAQFSVTVTHVNITNVQGKAKRTISAKGRRVANGRQNDFKKAYVSIKTGEKLSIFAAVEADEKKAEKVQEAAAKAIEKQEKKEEKQSQPKRLLGRRRAKKETE